MIPKQRFDEVVVERNRLREERELQSRTVASLTNLVQQARQPQARPAQEDPRVKKLRESGNNELADLMVQQEASLRQLRGATKTMADDFDRERLLRVYGPKAQSELQKIEQIVEAERSRGNYAVSREGVFLWLKGQEKLIAEQNALQAPQGGAQQSTAPVHQAAEDAPGQDPKSLTRVPQGGASVGTGDKTREQREKELENFEF